MQLKWISGLVLAVLLPLASANSQDVDELSVKVDYLPTDCPVKTEKGDKVEMHYTGTLYSNGEKFDSSLDRKQPLTFTVGAGQVIKGWDQGLLEMCVGEKRTLTIPSSLAYGKGGFPPVIPESSALVFDVELVKIVSSKKPKAEL
ncbi:hypothetical protein BOTBODRAFT_26123 [Botryobasidium botryosum FD-172 SS1]|uniref:peptidylprolyl isomerase n=1 Tax=Botryobasidium botryosum (strain FD-172 SS1) TaxID=930990 RepID=A0A067NC33_BOTB1|nr:hypothetical protein BOTBODRAFT_26123 [Botryobasidium botryosum FD-172 SS1]